MIVIVTNTSCNFTNFLNENTGYLKLSYFGSKFTQKKMPKNLYFLGMFTKCYLTGVLHLCFWNVLSHSFHICYNLKNMTIKLVFLVVYSYCIKTCV